MDYVEFRIERQNFPGERCSGSMHATDNEKPVVEFSRHSHLYPATGTPNELLDAENVMPVTVEKRSANVFGKSRLGPRVPILDHLAN